MLYILFVMGVSSYVWLNIVKYIKSLKEEDTGKAFKQLENVQISIESEYLGHCVVTAPKNSVIKSVNVSEGSNVNNSSILCIFENGEFVYSPIFGQINKIFVEPGDTVKKDDALFSIIRISNKEN